MLCRLYSPVAVKRQKIIKRQSRAQGQSFAEAIVDWHQKRQGPQQMRRDALQVAPFAQTLTHQRDFQVSQIAQSAMRQLGTVRRGGGGEIPRFDQRHL